VEWELAMETEVQEKTCPSTLCTPQIPHDLGPNLELWHGPVLPVIGNKYPSKWIYVYKAEKYRAIVKSELKRDEVPTSIGNTKQAALVRQKER
jgi:hypothetical protein